MASQKKIVIVALFIASIMMITGVLALIQSTKTIPSNGTIAGVNVNVYTDASYTTLFTGNLTWGTLSNGTTTTHPIYIKNDGKSLSMKLSLGNNSWSPSGADTYMNLTWDQEGTILAPSGTVTATLSMWVSPTYTTGTDFGVNIVITGTSQ